MKNRVFIPLVLFISFALVSGCDLLDPPPSDEEVAKSVSDYQAGMSSTSLPDATMAISGSNTILTNAARTVTLTRPTDTSILPLEATIVYLDFKGASNKVNGHLSLYQTTPFGGTITGKLAFTGGKVRTMIVDITSDFSGVKGTYTVNNWYVYDAATGKKK
jgi:hypothetical protein